MDWGNFLTSVISAVITGLITGGFTVLGVFITNKFYEKRFQSQQYKNKPRFIGRFTEHNDEKEIDLNLVCTTFKIAMDEKELFHFIYDNNLKNKALYHHIDIELTNIGANPAINLNIAVISQKSNAISSVSGINSLIDTRFVGFAVANKETYLKHDSKIRVRLNYLPEQKNNIGRYVLVYKDDYGNFWEQVLDFSNATLEEPFGIDSKQYLDDISPVSFIDELYESSKRVNK